MFVKSIITLLSMLMNKFKLKFVLAYFIFPVRCEQDYLSKTLVFYKPYPVYYELAASTARGRNYF